MGSSRPESLHWDSKAWFCFALLCFALFCFVFGYPRTTPVSDPNSRTF